MVQMFSKRNTAKLNITDISKIALLTNDANLKRDEIIRNWNGHVFKEIQLVKSTKCKIYTAGYAVTKYFIEHSQYYFCPIIHFSWRRHCFSRGSLAVAI